MEPTRPAAAKRAYDRFQELAGRLISRPLGGEIAKVGGAQVTTLACGHERSPFGSPVCLHLRTCKEPWIGYVRWFVGSGLEVELLCTACAELREGGSAVSTGMVCQECFERVTNEVGDLVGLRGKPETRTRSEPFSAELREAGLPREVGDVVDIAPIDQAGASVWLVLTDDGFITRFDAGAKVWARLVATDPLHEPGHQAWSGHRLKQTLHASPDGQFAAVVNDYGRFGQIVDLRSGVVTIRLDGGEYHPETVPFSFAFAQLLGRTVAIHRTSWNRLDISDPSSGAILSDRYPTSYVRGEDRPEHYLDYFHGALYLSPGGTRIADDGWVWHPIGIPTTWNMAAWMSNPWESEDGPSKKSICARNYYWDHGMTWIDEDLIALAGIGDDDELMTPGARIFDTTSPPFPGESSQSDLRWPRELRSFAGPDGIFFSDGTWLYSSNADGLCRWDLKDGARTGELGGFHPTHYHRGAGELAQVAGGTLIRWRSSW